MRYAEQNISYLSSFLYYNNVVAHGQVVTDLEVIISKQLRVMGFGQFRSKHVVSHQSTLSHCILSTQFFLNGYMVGRVSIDLLLTRSSSHPQVQQNYKQKLILLTV